MSSNPKVPHYVVTLARQTDAHGFVGVLSDGVQNFIPNVRLVRNVSDIRTRV